MAVSKKEKMEKKCKQEKKKEAKKEEKKKIEEEEEEENQEEEVEDEEAVEPPPRPLCVAKRLHVLKALNDEYEKSISRMREEMLALEQRYFKEWQPLFDKRETIVTGACEPTEKELEGFVAPKNATDKEEKGIPNFWRDVFVKHTADVYPFVKEDKEVFTYMRNLKVDFAPSEVISQKEGKVIKEGFTLNFFFAENPYFTDAVLSRSFTITHSIHGEIEVESTACSGIHWKEGKDYTKKEIETAKGKGKAKKRCKKTIPALTFMWFFLPQEQHDEEEEEDDDCLGMEDEEEQFKKGLFIKDVILQEAYASFMEKTEEDELAGEEGLSDLDEMDDEEEDEEEDEEDEPPRKGRKPAFKKVKAESAAKDQPPPPECQNQ